MSDLQKLRHSLLLSLLACASVLTVSAQPADIPAAMEQVSKDVQGLAPIVENIAAVVMAIMGVIAGVNVFNKWSNGDQQARQSALAWFSAVIFAGFLMLFVRAIFNV